MAVQKYLDFDDIELLPAINNKSDAKIKYGNITCFVSVLEDYLWDEWQFSKYGESYEAGVLGDELSDEIDKEFIEWISENKHFVYEYLDKIKE